MFHRVNVRNKFSWSHLTETSQHPQIELWIFLDPTSIMTRKWTTQVYQHTVQIIKQDNMQNVRTAECTRNSTLPAVDSQAINYGSAHSSCGNWQNYSVTVVIQSACSESDSMLLCHLHRTEHLPECLLGSFHQLHTWRQHSAVVEATTHFYHVAAICHTASLTNLSQHASLYQWCEQRQWLQGQRQKLYLQGQGHKLPQEATPTIETI